MITEIGQRSSHTQYSDKIKIDFWNIIIESKLTALSLKMKVGKRQLKRHMEKTYRHNMC